jgi:hypothetical protein
MKHRLHAEVDIEATPKTVWQILADLERYSEWNPFVVSSHGTVAVGERLVNRLQPPGGKARTFKPTVTIVEAGETLEWLGHLGFRNLFDGRHRFDLSATPTGTRFTQSEEFSGVLVRFMRRSLDGDTLRGFEAMNAALKTRAEAHDAAS